MFELAARLIAAFYAWTHSYSVAIGLVAIVVMLIITPLTLKSTKGMLEMQRLQPEMRRLQTQFKGDRQQLNAEMMKLYQEHKVNPLASCLPLLAQMPVFIIMFQALSGLGNRVEGLLAPKYLNETSELFISLNGKAEMRSFGLDLSITPQAAVQDSFGKGLVYIVLVAALAALYFVQQRMVASRTVSPTMSATQAKIMQYLPVVFAVFQLFLPTSLVVYYIVQAIVRIVQQYYITKRFYGNDDSLGRQAQAASAKARDIAENDKQSKKDTPPSNEPFQSTPRKGSESSQVSRRPQAPGKNRTGSLDRKKKK
jgi:YidC/Oxa1 family membrane protein insertase